MREKKPFEVLDEIQELALPLREYATVLNMLIGYFDLSNRELSDIERRRLADGHENLYNAIMLVLRGLLDVDDKITNFKLQEESEV